MKNSVVNHLLALVVCLNFYVSKAQGGMLKEVKLEEQLKASHTVIEGKVIGKSTLWNDARDKIYTVHTVKVYKVFKGELIDFVEVITEGGRVEEIEQVVLPSLRLDINAVGIFTLQEANEALSNLKTVHKVYKVYSSLQGFYAHDVMQDVIRSGFAKSSQDATVFYNKIANYTKQAIVTIDVLEKNKRLSFKSASALAPQGITFTPSTATAGTLTILTINGTDFGTTNGAVGFRNADSGGITRGSNTPSYRDALESQILSWTNTQIRVRIPFWAGTGDVRVTKSDATQGVSSQILTIDAAVINDSQGRRTQHVSQNNTGNIMWEFNTQFNANTDAKASFLRALDTWRCETRINWEVASNASPVARSASDGVNIITFDTASNPLPEGVLGLTNYFIAYCGGERGAVTEIDMVFNDNLNDPATPANESWYFGENPQNISFAQWDFQSVALHELGHAHQLGHVVNTDDAMHYAISNFEIQRGLNTKNIDAAQDIQQLGTTGLVCSFSRMTDYSADCVLEANIQDLGVDSIAIYPNPVTDHFFITNPNAFRLEYLKLYDLQGRLITHIYLNNKVDKLQRISTNALDSGVYMAYIYAEQGAKSVKLVVD